MKDTLECLLIDLTMYGADRGAFVRQAQEGKDRAVCIIMTSKPALAKLGPPIRDLAASITKADQSSWQLGQFDHRVKLSTLFDLGSQAPNGWCWAMFRYHDLEVTLAIFSREIEQLARVCLENGLPVPLDPQYPAPWLRCQDNRS